MHTPFTITKLQTNLNLLNTLAKNTHRSNENSTNIDKCVGTFQTNRI